MAGKSKGVSILSVFIVILLITVFGADLFYAFGNYDTPFVLAILFYLLYIWIQRSASRLTFTIVLFLIIGMGFSYMFRGPDRLTERIGQWFYLFFVLGLFQYTKEAAITKLS